SPQTVTGYYIYASSGAWPNCSSLDFRRIIFRSSATTFTFNLGTLTPDTTYFVRVGALFSEATSYANTVPQSTSTLANLLSNVLKIGRASCRERVKCADFAGAPDKKTATG